MLTNLKAPSFLRRLLLPAAVAGALAFGMVAGESTASAQQFGVEVVPPSPGYGYAWAPGYWGYRPGFGRTWYGGRWNHPGYGGGYGHGGYGHGGTATARTATAAAMAAAVTAADTAADTATGRRPRATSLTRRALLSAKPGP